MSKEKRQKIFFIDKLIQQLYQTCHTEEEIKNIYDEIKLINLKYGNNINKTMKKRDN